MTDIVVCVGEGKGTWKEVFSVLSDEWDKVFIITQDFFKDKIKFEKPHELIVIDASKDVVALVADLEKAFTGKFFGDVAVSLVSGSGKEHMAILAALMKSGAGIRLVYSTEKGAQVL